MPITQIPSFSPKKKKKKKKATRLNEDTCPQRLPPIINRPARTFRQIN